MVWLYELEIVFGQMETIGCSLIAGLSLKQVPRVPGTRKILSSYAMAPVNFYEIPGEQLPGTRKILSFYVMAPVNFYKILREQLPGTL